VQVTAALIGGVSMAVACASLAAAQSTTPLKPLPAIQLEASTRRPELDGPRFSLAFSAPTPIRDVLLLLVRDTKLSVVPAPSLDQRFVGDLKNVTLREALDLILDPVDLDYAVEGQVLRVHPRELETRFYNIDHVITQRTGRRSIGGPIEVSSVDAKDVYADLADSVRTLLSADGRMNIDRSAGLLQVTDRPRRLARVQQYLETAMLRVMRQVQIEAKVFEIELRDPASSDIDWRALVGALPRTIKPQDGAEVTLTIPAENVAALLASLGARGTVTVLSTSLITAMNNEPAVLRAGTSSDVTPAENMGLSITPQIGTEGIIHMSVSATMSAQSLVREADGVFQVRQGETVIIPGLNLRRTAGRTTDVVILLTPTILHARAAR
jgi:type II secretory pathway component GspD/PulD (secretin)